MDTIRMFQEENLDVRAVTLGLDLRDCASPNLQQLIDKMRAKLVRFASSLKRVADEVGREFGVQVVNKRIAVTPIASVASAHGAEAMVRIAKALDEAADQLGVDFIGGMSAMVHKGITPSARALIDALPQALGSTSHVCGSLNVATTRAGINMDAVRLAGQTITALAQTTAGQGGIGAAKLVVFANIPEDNPFMAGAICGEGEGEATLNVGVSGPGVVKRALERLIAANPGDKLTLTDLAEEIKITAFRVARVGELIGREVAGRLGVRFGILDLSLAPTPKVGDSIGEILQVMGIRAIGGPGSTAAIAMLNDAVKKGGAFASSSVGGLSGAFIPVMEDHALAEAARDGSLTLAKLEAMTSVCSVGLDMVALPGDTDSDTLAAIIADEMAIGVVNNKTTACRLIPVPGKKAGESVSFGGLFGESAIMPVRDLGESATFVRFGGRIPAPVQSLRN
ncbi:MAG: PFL family protein [Phycisphaeraceae bacterium]|nr:PFL family protein [Phycisphaeraceae bacterium]